MHIIEDYLSFLLPPLHDPLILRVGVPGIEAVTEPINVHVVEPGSNTQQVTLPAQRCRNLEIEA